MTQTAGPAPTPGYSSPSQPRHLPDPGTLRDTIERDGIAGLPGLFPRSWAEELRADFDAAFAQALSREGGTIPRGPQRHYFAVHPEHVRGFADVAGHPVIVALCELMLGPDYRIAVSYTHLTLPTICSV